MDLITLDLKSCIITILIGLTTYYLVKFYMRVASYPPGPIPLPIIGNILMLSRFKQHPSYEFAKLRQKYGPVATFWMGNIPLVFIYDYDLARDAFKQNAFSGRPDSFFGKVFSNDNSSDVIWDDYGHRWEALRRVAHSAARNYAVTDKLAFLINEIVDETVSLIKEKEGTNKPFSLFDHNHRIFLNIFAESAFRERFNDFEDPEYKEIHDFFSNFVTVSTFGPYFALVDFLPFMRINYKSMINKAFNSMEKILTNIKNKYTNHYKDFNEGVTRDFCDALISVKNNALNEGKESAPYLTDENMARVVFDLFLAGIHTSQITLNWIILLMANFPECQKRMREEIDSVIGERMPVQDDRNICHYVNAFISEAMRFRVIAPMSVFHKNMVQTKIGDITIPSNTAVFTHLHCIMNDPKHWKNPETFRPERFLENDKYLTSRPNAFIPFGTGRRICLGEKLAINNAFLVLVRLLQSTNEYEIALESGPGSADLEPVTVTPDNICPKAYNVMLKK